MSLPAVESNQLQWGGSDAFTHTLVVGPTRCGKTALILKPIIFQILEQRAKGIPAGMTVIEPKGDVVRDVKEICDELGVEYHYIDPLYPDESEAINVMKGPKIDIAEATVAVLKSMFGKQEAFFQYIQELSARKITMLLKTLYKDDVYLIDVLKNLRDEDELKRNVERLRMKNVDPDLVDFFDSELLKGKDSDKFRSLVLGLRAQLDNLMSNEYLQPLISRQSDMDLDEHFEKGGILAINTALGKLGAAGDAFGQFVAMHMQLATFRRPGTEDTRVPHYLIIDEYSRYINPDVERFLSIAAEYRVAGIFAVQSLGQLEVESGQTNAQAMKKAILTSCRNKIIFGGLSGEDAKEVSIEMGMDMIEHTEKRYDGSVFRQLQPKMTSDKEIERERFTYSTIMDGIPRFHFIHKLLIDGTPQPPGLAVGKFIPKDPEELRAHFKKVKAEHDLEKQRQELLEKTVPKWNIVQYIEHRKKLALIEKKLKEQKASLSFVSSEETEEETTTERHTSMSVIDNPKMYQLYDPSQERAIMEEKTEWKDIKEKDDNFPASTSPTEEEKITEEEDIQVITKEAVTEIEETTDIGTLVKNTEQENDRNETKIKKLPHPSDNHDTNVIINESRNNEVHQDEVENNSDNEEINKSKNVSVNTNLDVFIVNDVDKEDEDDEEESIIVVANDKENEDRHDSESGGKQSYKEDEQANSHPDRDDYDNQNNNRPGYFF